MGGFESARNAAVYYNLAKDFFGLGDSVSPTTHFLHPKGISSDDGGSHWFASKKIKSCCSPLHSQDAHMFLQNHRDGGELHKLAIMDIISGLSDRGHHNVLSGQDGKILHIDNDSAFEFGPFFYTGYIEEINDQPGIKFDSVHPAARIS